MTKSHSANDGMTSLKPHILRGVYDWILENNLTPHILVNANSWGVKVPRQHVEEGKIVLNIEPMAVRDFEMNNTKLTFKARFQGISQQVLVPVRAVLAIFAAENGRGQLFTGTEFEADDTPAQALTNTVLVTPEEKLQQSTDPNETDKITKLTLIAPHQTSDNDDDGGGDDNGGGPGSGKRCKNGQTNKKTKGAWLRLIK